MTDDTQRFEDLTASFAGRFGVTPRALRVYEKAGLLKPRRTASGWRVYGRAEADRLYRIMALKSLGLSLAQIGDALNLTDLSGVLAVQERALESARSRTEQGLKLVRAARARLQDGAALSADDLTNLIKETEMNTTAMTEKYAALVQRHLGGTMAELIPPEMSVADLIRIQEDWLAMIKEGEEKKHLDPAGDEAQDYVRRLAALIRRSARDEDEIQRQGAFFEAGYADPDLAGQMPFSRELWEFTKEAKAHADALDGAV